MSEEKSFSDTVENHFPITVMERRYRHMEALNERLFAWLRRMASQFEDSAQNAVKSGKIATMGGYQTARTTNIFRANEPQLRILHDRYIAPGVREYLRTVFREQANNLNISILGWSNLLRKGDWQKPHFHPTKGNLASGVYYVRMPKIENLEGCIEFINPHPISVHHGFNATRRVVPEEGLLLMFPPFYMHYVHPFRYDAERAVISFDVMVTQDQFRYLV